MSKIIDKLYNSFYKTKLIACLISLAVYFIYIELWGGHIWEAGLFALCAAAYIVLPGMFFTRVFCRKAFPERFKLLFTILSGSGFFAALYCLAVRLNIILLLYIIPLVISAAYIVGGIISGRGKELLKKLKGRRPKNYQWLLILLYAALLLLYTFGCVIKYARPSMAGDSLSNQDLLWYVGNANSFKLAFPPQDIHFLGVRLQYHYFTELIAGALSIVSGISCYNILAFYFQPLLMTAMIACLYRFAHTVFKGNIFKTILFVYMPFIFTDVSLVYSLIFGRSLFWNSYTSHLISNINGYATATVFLCIFLCLFVQASRDKYKMSLIYYLSILASFFILCFSKGPVAALLICGLVLSLIVGLFQKFTKSGGVLIGLGCLGIFILVFYTIFSSGTRGSVRFSIFDTMFTGRLFGDLMLKVYSSASPFVYPLLFLLMIVQVFLMFPAQLPLLIRGLGPDLKSFSKIPPERMLAYAMVPGGILGYYFFFHTGMSQIYFLFCSSFFISYIAVDNTDYIKKALANKVKLKRNKRIIGVFAFAAAVAVLTTAMLYTYMLGSGLRQQLRNAGVLEKYPYPYIDSADDEAAMEWLAENSEADAIFATNRVHANPINNFYTAMSGRQCFIEEYTYTQSNMGLSEEALNKRFEENRIIFSPGSTEEEIIALCNEYNISYLVYSRQRGFLEGSDDVIKNFSLVFDSDKLSIYKLP